MGKRKLVRIAGVAEAQRMLEFNEMRVVARSFHMYKRGMTEASEITEVELDQEVLITRSRR